MSTWTITAQTGFGGGGGSGGGIGWALLGIMTFGLDDDTVGANAPGHYGNIEIPGVPVHASISCVTPPTSAAAIFDVLLSTDNGATWNSIFVTGSPFTYPTTATGLVQFSGIFATTATFAIGNMLRVDVIQSGGAQGITGVVRWNGTGGGSASSIRDVAVNTTMTTSDYTVVATVPSITITLPAAPMAGQIMNVKNGNTTAGQLITVAAPPGVLIDQSNTVSVGATASLLLQWDATQWRIL